MGTASSRPREGRRKRRITRHRSKAALALPRRRDLASYAGEGEDDEGERNDAAWRLVLDLVRWDARDLIALQLASRRMRLLVRDNARSLSVPCTSAEALYSLPSLEDFVLIWSEGEPLPPVRDYRTVGIVVVDRPPSSVTVGIGRPSADRNLSAEPAIGRTKLDRPSGCAGVERRSTGGVWRWPQELRAMVLASIAVSRPSLRVVVRRPCPSRATFSLHDGRATSTHPLTEGLVSDMRSVLALRHETRWSLTVSDTGTEVRDMAIRECGVDVGARADVGGGSVSARDD